MAKTLEIKKRILREEENLFEINYTITNTSAQEVYLSEVEAYAADSLGELGFGEDCLLLRTGRHKNDMPSVARFGVMDTRMQDALGGEFERLEMKNGRLDYKLKAAYDYPGQYRVWLPDGRVEKLSLMSAAVSASAAR